MRLRAIIIGIATATLGVAPLVCHAQAYRWTDSHGVVHFSQTPPDNQTSTQVNDAPISTLSTPGSQASPGARPTTKPTPSSDSTQARAAKAGQKQCDSVRADLKLMQSGRRLRVKMPDGSIHVMSAAERERNLKQAKDFLAQRCN